MIAEEQTSTCESAVDIVEANSPAISSPTKTGGNSCRESIGRASSGSNAWSLANSTRQHNAAVMLNVAKAALPRQ